MSGPREVDLGVVIEWTERRDLGARDPQEAVRPSGPVPAVAAEDAGVVAEHAARAEQVIRGEHDADIAIEVQLGVDIGAIDELLRRRRDDALAVERDLHLAAPDVYVA